MIEGNIFKPKPSWTKKFETDLLDCFQSIDQVLVFGSLKNGELGYGKKNGLYYLLSDIDLHSKLNPVSVEKHISKENLLPLENLKLDVSNVYHLASPIQHYQRLGFTATELRPAPEKDIIEAISIRLFYSLLSIYESRITDDSLMFIYSVSRLISEIPLYVTWRSGNYRFSYSEQLNLAVESLNDEQVISELKESVFIKTNLIDLDDDYFSECWVLSWVENKLRAFDLFLLEIGISSFFITQIVKLYKLSVVRKFVPVKNDIQYIWDLYSRDLMDGRTRKSYLTKRVKNIISFQPNKSLQRTKIPLRFILAAE